MAWILLAWSLPAVSGSDRAGDLIQEAHQHDGMYNLGPQVNPDSAISLYHRALQFDPNDQQKLHILHRSAELYVYSDHPDKHTKAIELNQQIIAEFPTDELAVLRAMNSLAKNYRALGQNMKALEWAKRMIDRNADRNQTAGSESAPGQDDAPQGYRSRERAQQIRLYKEVAVDQVAQSARLVDPLVVDAELNHIAAEYPNTYLAEKASQLLEEIAQEWAEIAKHEDAVHVPWDGIPTNAPGTTLQTGVSAAGVTTDNNNPKEADSPANKDQTRTAQGQSRAGDITSLAHDHEGRPLTSRGPPWRCLIAGLLLVGVTVCLRVYWPKTMKVAKSSEV
jgi:tetratricopeptide (TPR) repeat protein